MSKKKEQKLNLRERRFIKFLFAGKCPTEAMRLAGYAETTARVKQGRKLAQVRPTIQALMETHGINDDRLLTVLDEGLKADKVISANIIAASGEGMADANSMTKDFIEVPDHFVRHKFLDTALTLKASYPVEKKEITANVTTKSGVLLVPVVSPDDWGKDAK